MKALTGVTGTSGDRPGDFQTLLLTNSYAAPNLRITQTNTPAGIVLLVTQDTPGLNYQAQMRTDFASPWQAITAATNYTGTLGRGKSTPLPVWIQGSSASRLPWPMLHQ